MIRSKKVLYVILVMFLMLSFILSNIVYASDLDTILKIVQTSSEKKDLPDNQRIYF